MTSKISKIIAGIAASIVSLGAVFYIIDAIDMVIDLSEFSEDFYEALGSLYIFQLVLMIIAVIVGITAAVVSFTPVTSKKNAVNCLLATGLFIVLEKLTYRIGVMVITKKYLYPDANFNASTIISIVFIVLAILSMLTALFMNQYKKNMAGSILGAVGTLWLFVVIIMDLCRDTETTGFNTIYLIFTLVGSIIMIGAFVLAGFKDSARPVLAKSTPVIEKPSDNAEELLKLKKLLDAGAITQEEYEEKRQKYVDKL